MAVNDKRSFVDGNPVATDPEQESPPTLAVVEAPPDPGEAPRAHDLELTAADILEAAGKEGLLASLVVGAADMLNRFLDVDHDWTLKVVGAAIPASPSVAEAADAGELPFKLTPTRGGQRITSLVGMINALLRHVGCDGNIEVRWWVDAKTKAPVQLVGFYPVLPGDEEGDGDE